MLKEKKYSRFPFFQSCKCISVPKMVVVVVLLLLQHKTRFIEFFSSIIITSYFGMFGDAISFYPVADTQQQRQWRQRRQQQCMLADRVISNPCSLVVRHSVLGTFIIIFFILNPLSFTVSNTYTCSSSAFFPLLSISFSLALSLPSTFFDVVEVKKNINTHTHAFTLFSLHFHVLRNQNEQNEIK